MWGIKVFAKKVTTMNFPRSKSYDPDLVRAHMMGPNAMKILEELSVSLDLKPGMRVLDLGCGQGLTSIFLAREFGVTVFAVDLWIAAAENYRRFRDFGLDNQIIPLHLDAHGLPFAEEYFDAAICVDAYHYFGTAEDYLAVHLAPMIKRGGQIGMAVPGFKKEYGAAIPKDISPFVKPDFNFHSSHWWSELWQRSGQVTVQTCRDLDCCAEAWADWLTCDENEYAVHDRDMMKVERGRFFSIVGITAQRNEY
jgi:cyclopropane fatty-acyl-phospholipid synthase-like methyltransferase